MKAFFAVRFKVLTHAPVFKRKWYTLFLYNHVVTPEEFYIVYAAKDTELLGKDFDPTRLTVGTRISFLGDNSITRHFELLDIDEILVPSIKYSVFVMRPTFFRPFAGLRVEYNQFVSKQFVETYTLQGWNFVESLDSIV